MTSAAAGAAPVVAPTLDFFLARQPILGREQQLLAYELLFRSAGSGAATVTDDAAATAAVIMHASQLGLERVVGDQLAFVNIDAVVLLSDFIRFLPNDKVILEILETVKATPEVLARIIELKQAGFKFALDDVIADSEDVRAFIPLVDVIKIDIMGMSQSDLGTLTRMLKSPKRKMLAEKVETIEEFEHCLALGFDYFQGYYFARPVILSGRKIPPSELAVLNLLDLINSDAADSAIVHSIKIDPLISLNLLRLVNTPAAGVRTRIDSAAQALMVLGRRQLQRWLQILLYAKPGKRVEFTSPLLQMASTRGKMLELMTQKIHHAQHASADIGFTVGILSLMDTLFSMPMADVLDTLAVTDEVRDALLKREGDFGRMLELVECLEAADQGPAMRGCLRALGISVAELGEMQLRAFEWVSGLAHQA